MLRQKLPPKRWNGQWHALHKNKIMKIKIFSMIVGVCTIAWAVTTTSCKKQDATTTVEVQTEIRSTRGGGKGDDKPVIIHRVNNQFAQPITGARVEMINNSDSLHSFTDVTGECSLTIPALGNWQLKVNHQGYQAIDTMINVTDTVSVFNAVLRLQ
jgi:hypothetical protein